MDQRDLPWIYPPPGFKPIDRNNKFIVPPESNKLIPPKATINIPAMQEGWVVLAGIEMSDYPDEAYYTIARSGISLPDYAKVQVPLGSTSTPAPLHLHILPNQPITLSFTNPVALADGGAPIITRWRMYGWYYPSKFTGGA